MFLAGDTVVSLRSLIAVLALLALAVPAAAAENRDALAVFRDCPTCPEMVVVPAGTFMMGSPADEEGRASAEGPLHRVSVAPFAIGRYEVSFAEWDACLAAGGCDGYRPADQGWGRGARPVINVSWQDANAYAAWLSRTTGHAYRLPSEAEWEYAARAGTATPFHFGATLSAGQANYGQGIGKTAPVGSFPSNAFGLHDVHGNVWERVEDCYRDNYKGAPGDGRAWLAGGDCGARVLRGGSWDNEPKLARAAYRGWVNLADRYDVVGFRIARTLEP